MSKLNGGSSSFSNGSSRKRSQRLLLLVLALGMATVSVMLFHKLREGRVFGLLLQDQDRQIVMLQLLLQRERENTEEIKRKLENMRARNFILSTQKTELADKLTETQTAADHLQKTQSEMETFLEEKQNEIKGLADKAEESVIRANLQVAEITELLKQKETEVQEMKEQLKKLSTPENNTVSQASEGTGASNGNEVKSEENEHTPKEGKWVKVQTNVGDESSKDGDGEASDGHENTSEVKQQSRELNGEGKADNKADAETSQGSTTEVQEQNKESRNDQGMSDNLEIKEPVAAQDGEEVKPADSQYGTRKVRRYKSRGKGRRRRKSNNSVKEDNTYGAKESNGVEDEQKETTREIPKLETPGGSQADGSSNSEGQSNSETMTEGREEKTVSGNQQLENAQNQKDGEGYSTDGNVEGEEMEKEQSEKSENPQDDEAKKENGNDKTGAATATELGPEKESDAEKQDGVVEEEAGVNSTPIANLTDDDNAAAAEDGEDSKIQEGNNTDRTVDGAEKAVEAESQKSEKPQEDEAKNETNGEETGASANLKTEKESEAEKQEEVVKEEADVNVTSVTEQRDTDNAADHQTQASEDSNNTNDSSSISESKDEEDTELKGNGQNDNGQDTSLI